MREVSETEANLTAKLERLNNECLEAQAEKDEVAYRSSKEARCAAQIELDELRREKAKAIKPNGQPRELNKPNAKQHEAVRGAIRRAVEHLGEKKLTRLALHFGDFAKPDGAGTGYVYCPEPKVTWSVEKAIPTG